MGFLLLAYAGEAPTERRWRGPETGIAYWFGPGSVRYVDRLDGLRLLRPQGGGVAFRPIQEEGDDDRHEGDQAGPVPV